MTNEEFESELLKLKARLPDRGAGLLARKLKREAFIDALATYLTRDLAKRSIWLEMGEQSEHYRSTKEWQTLYQAAGLFGYPTKEEAIKTLTEFL